MNLQTFIFKRLLPLPVVLLGVTMLVFAISYIVPADPVAVALGENATPEQREALREALGLNQPLVVQYFNYMVGLFQGDMGTSLVTKRPVLDDLAKALPASLELTTVAMLFAIVVSIPLGVIGASYINKWPDYLTRVISLIGVSLERAWVAVLLQLVIAVSLGFPIISRISGSPPPPITNFYLIDSLLAGDLAKFFDAASHILLPAFALSLGALAQIARIVRSRMIEEHSQDYVRAAYSQGLRPSVITFKYMLRNSLPTVLTVIGLSYGSMLGNAFLIENVFGWPGLGLYGVQAISNNDLPSIAGVSLILGIVFVSINTLIDILYGYIDPRVRAA
jgi:peptide/nickel transport system permease protein